MPRSPRTRGPLLRVFQHERGIILGRRERLSKILVVLVTVVIGLFMVFLAANVILQTPFSGTDVCWVLWWVSCFYFIAWVFPSYQYREGLGDRKVKKLRYWMASFSLHTFLLELYCFSNIKCLGKEYRQWNSYQCDNYTVGVVVAGIVMLPFILVVLGVTVDVYLNIDKAVEVVDFPIHGRRGGNAKIWRRCSHIGPRSVLRSWRGRKRTRVEARPRQIVEERNRETVGERNRETVGERNNQRIGERNRETAEERNNQTMGERNRETVVEQNRERNERTDEVSNTTGSGEAEETNSWIYWGRSQYNSAVEGSSAVTRNWLPVLSSGGATEGILGLLGSSADSSQNVDNQEEIRNERPLEQILVVNLPDEVSDIDEDLFVHYLLDSPDNDVPPSYGEVEQDDLPSYSQLGTKRIQIGSTVILMDKKLNLNTFQQV